jgi:cytoskeleton protein RodZ
MSDLPRPDIPSAGSSAGALIRQSREAQGLSLASMAQALKVPQRKLEALEADRWDELRDLTFARALAQTVCRFLKLDPAPVMAGMPGAVVQSLSDWSSGINAPFRDRSGRAAAGWLGILSRPIVWGPGVIVLAALAIYLFPKSWSSHSGSTSEVTETVSALPSVPQEPADVPGPQSTSLEPVPGLLAASSPLELPAPASASPASAAVSPSMASTAAPVPQANTGSSTAGAVAMPGPTGVPPKGTMPGPLAGASPVPSPSAAAPSVAGLRATGSGAVLPAGTPVTSPAAPNTASSALTPAAQLDAVFAVDQPCWIRVRDSSGVMLISRMVEAGERVSLSGSSPLQVVVGNAAHAKLWVKGRPIDLAPSTRENVARIELR